MRRLRTLWKRSWPGLCLAALESLALLAWVLAWSPLAPWRAPTDQALTFASFHAPLWLWMALRWPVRWRGGMYAAHVYRPRRVELEQSLWTELITLGMMFVLVLALSDGWHAHEKLAGQFGLPILWLPWLVGWIALLNIVVARARRRLAWLHLRCLNVLNVLVVGTGPNARRFIDWADNCLGLGYGIVGVVRTTPIRGMDRGGYDVLAQAGENLGPVVRRHAVDLVVLTDDIHPAPPGLASFPGVVHWTSLTSMGRPPRGRHHAARDYPKKRDKTTDSTA